MSAPESLREELSRLVDAPPQNPDRLDTVRARARRIRRNRVAGAVGSAVAAVVVAALVGMLTGTNQSAPVDPLAPPATKLPTDVLLVNQQGVVSRLPEMADRVLEPVRGLRLFGRASAMPVAGGRVLATDPDRDLILVDPKRPGSSTVVLRVSRLVTANAGIGVPRRTKVPFLEIPGVGPRIVARMIVERGGERVWLVTARTLAAALAHEGPFEVYAMDLTGRVDPTPIRLPAGTEPVAAGRAGFFAYAQAGGQRKRVDFVRIDESGKQTMVRRNVIGNWFTVSNGEAVLSDCCDGGRPVLFDADTGRSVPVQPGGRLSIGGRLAADLITPLFSVDGRYLVDGATPPVLPLIMDGPNAGSGWAWLVVDTTTGRTTLVPGTRHYGVQREGELGQVQWSGDRLVWTEEFRHRTLVGAYLPVNGRSVVTTVPARGLSLLGAS